MQVNIPETFYWSTTYYHANNQTTMSEFLEYYLPEEYEVIFVDGTYAEITSEDNCTFYEVHASGNGDFYNNKIKFKEYWNE